MTAKVICCNCQKDMGTKGGFVRPSGWTGELITSGLCPECIDKQMAEYGLIFSNESQEMK
jgi:hypothetical protein